MELDPYLLAVGLLLLTSLAAAGASSRVGVPALLLFLAIGMLLGSDGPGGVPFDNAEQAQSLGTVALVFIMFHGGLQTGWAHVRPVVLPALSLATLGVAISTFLVAGCVHFLGHVGWTPSLLLGATVSSTDAAALFSVMRTQGISLKGNLNSLLELESGTNDPMAVFLTTAFVEHMVARDTGASFTLSHAILDLVREMGLGALMGVMLGRVLVYALRRLDLPSEGMYVVLTTGTALVAYGLTQVYTGSGFLAVYVLGLCVGSYRVPRSRMLEDVHDGIAWLMQIAMFLTLGLLVYPSHLVPEGLVAVTVGLFLIFVARPIAVFVSLALTRLDWREKLLVSWCGLRGAVPIILATFPMVAQVNRAERIFHVVFFIVILSVLVQGTTVPYMAHLLGLRADPSSASGGHDAHALHAPSLASATEE